MNKLRFKQLGDLPNFIQLANIGDFNLTVSLQMGEDHMNSGETGEAGGFIN